MNKLSLTLALFGALICLSTAQTLTRECPRKCALAYRCSPYYKDLVWSIVDGTCRVFQNGCIFGSENCNRVNSCKTKMERTTREKCMKYCSEICPFGGSGVCASFASTNADGTTSWKTRTFLNRCLLNQYACQKGDAYIAPICLACGQFALPVPHKCHDVCPTGYRVVCALHEGCLRTFASSCVMRMYNCKYQKDYRIISQRACEFISNEELRKLEL